MTMKLTGRNGVLRIYDSAPVGLSFDDRDEASVDMVTWDGAAAWANITTHVRTFFGTIAEDFLTDNNDAVFIGCDLSFASVRFSFWTGDPAVGSGALKAYYFDGTDFTNELSGVEDGTTTGGDCFAQDGYIGFKIPRDWSIGANSVNANLDSDKFYIKLMCTTSPSTNPDADILRPTDGLYYEVPFANMDLSGPIGRALTEEILVMNRGGMDAYAHYIEGIDDKIYEAIPLSFSCLIDDTYNNEQIFAALECGTPGTTYWTAAGTSSKGDTQNDGTNDNPAFVDATKKTVNIQILFSGATYSIGLAFYEVYFHPDMQKISEGDDAITLSCEGGVFGLIEKIHAFGNRY